MNIDLQARAVQPLRQTFARVAAYTGDKTASRYQEATLGVQSTANFQYRPTWEPEFELFDTGRTAVKLADWDALRDPRQYYYANWTMARARQQEAVESSYQFVESRGLVAKMSDALRAQACAVLMPLRRHVENTLVLLDPFEVFVAQNLALDGLLFPLIYTHFVDDHLAPQGGTAVSMLTAFMPEWHDESARWIDAVVKVAAVESDANRSLITGWYQSYADQAQAALAPVAELALGARGAEVLQAVRADLDARARKAGLAL